MGRISWSLVCLSIGLVAYSNLSLWSQFGVPTGSVGGLPLAFGDLPVLALQIFGIPMIIVGLILFAWGIYDWVKDDYKKTSSLSSAPSS